MSSAYAIPLAALQSPCVQTAMMENPLSASARPDTIPVLIRQIRFEGRSINSYELVDPAGNELPPFTPGAHIDVHLDGGVVRQYSLCNEPCERHRYVIAVLKDDSGRGGSKKLHDSLRVQDVVSISRPRNNFPLVETATRVVLLAGGIGVTPLKSMAHSLERASVDYQLHYCTKNIDCTAFSEELNALAARGRLHYHFDGGDPAQGLDIAQLLAAPAPGTHVYYCGPEGFMKACAAAALHWAPGTVHFEHFKVPAQTTQDSSATAPDRGFTVEMASSGRRIPVGAGESIADALNAAGVPVETSCQSGLCGTCKTRYTSGQVDHQDCILSDAEHEEYLTVCVSRAASPLLVLDL